MALSKKNIAVVMFVGFVNYLEWAIVMTSIYPYIQSLSSGSSATAYLSLAQSLFPLGQGISQPIAGFVVKKRCEIKIVIIASLIIAIGGNITYMTASKANSVALIILGRALAGFGAGSGGVAYGFIGANTSRENRAKLMSYFRVTCMLGVMSSTIASATFLPGFGENALGKATGLNEFSAPAALTILCLCFSLILVVFLLDEKNCSPIGERDNNSVSILKSLKSRGVLLGLMLFLLNGFVTTWVGYVLPLVAFDHFKFDLDQFGWLMVGVSGTATFGSLAMTRLSKVEFIKDSKNGDWRVLVTCYTFMALGIVLAYLGGPSVLASAQAVTKEGLFLAGVLTVFLTYSMVGVVLPTLTTKYLAKSMMPVIMPYCIASMSAGKVIAPLLSKLESVIQGWDLLFMGAVGLTLFGFLVFICFYRAPEHEETPLLPDRKQPSSDRRYSADSEEDNLACTSVVYSVDEGVVHQPGRRKQDMS